jgi:hypothetical protein
MIQASVRCSRTIVKAKLTILLVALAVAVLPVQAIPGNR